jgi:FMN phosphatase YigB (HAD superfamily)
VLVSYQLGARKPTPELYHRALARYGVAASDAFLADDTLANVVGARAVGITSHWLEYVDGVPQTDALLAAIESFASRPTRIG